MTRILFWLALAFLVVAAIRSKLRSARRPPPPPPPAPEPRRAGERQAQARAQAALNAETMLCCAHCGVYFPASENVQIDGRDYCSPAHARLPAS
ncbi:MAG: PP0621 family protein [Pseudomonadota bacterium]